MWLSSRFGCDDRCCLRRCLACVQAAPVKVGQLFPVVLLVFIWVIVVRAHYVIIGHLPGLLRLRDSEERERRDEAMLGG